MNAQIAWLAEGLTIWLDSSRDRAFLAADLLGDHPIWLHPEWRSEVNGLIAFGDHYPQQESLALLVRGMLWMESACDEAIDVAKGTTRKSDDWSSEVNELTGLKRGDLVSI